VVEKVEIHRDDVLDADEVPPLRAGRVTAGALEKLHFARTAILIEEMPHDRRHSALMRLARTVNVEIAKPGDLRSALGQHTSHIAVEQRLRIAVDIERRFVRAVFAEYGAGAIH
jgi:hypothetical protein